MRIYMVGNQRLATSDDEHGPLPSTGEIVQLRSGPRRVLAVMRVTVAAPGVEPVDRIDLGEIVDPFEF